MDIINIRKKVDYMTRLYRILIVGLLLVLPSAVHAAGSGRVAVGGWFSQKGSGLILVFNHSDATYGELRVNADFEQILKGRESVPGFTAQYWYNMHLATVRFSDELVVRPVAGPGVTVGYVRDHGKEPGFLVAVGGNVGLDFIFKTSPISIYAGLSAEVGAHVKGSTMSLYDNGLRRVWQPELSIRYRF